MYQNHINTANTSSTESLLHKVQDKVANYIIRQIDQQIDALEMQTVKKNDNCRPETLVTPTSETCEKK